MKGILNISNIIQEWANISPFINYYSIGTELEIPEGLEANYPIAYLEEPIRIVTDVTKSLYQFSVYILHTTKTDPAFIIPDLFAEQWGQDQAYSLFFFLKGKGIEGLTMETFTLSTYAEDNLAGVVCKFTGSNKMTKECNPIADEPVLIAGITDINPYILQFWNQNAAWPIGQNDLPIPTPVLDNWVWNQDIITGELFLISPAYPNSPRYVIWYYVNGGNPLSNLYRSQVWGLEVTDCNINILNRQILYWTNISNLL